MTDLRLEPPPSTLPPGSTVWAYLRDSGGPTQERSVEQQHAMVLEYCAKHGLILSLPAFTDVHKTGGTVKNRDDFDYMMSLSAVNDGRPNGLLIWNFARFSRGGAWDAQLYTATLRLRGIVIHSLTDKIPEGEFGPVIESIIHVANKQKKDEAAFGAWRGLRHNVKQGAVSGTLPTGFIKTPIQITSAEGIERTAHRWDPDPAFKVRINKAFQLKAEGKSISQIHAETKLLGSLNSYNTLFKNSIYIGILHFGDMIVPNYCPPTIPRSLWDKVQAVMESHAKRRHLNSQADHPRRKNSIYLLSGIIRCARCNSPMNGLSSPQPYGGDYRRYICSTAKNKKTCSAKPIPAAVVEKLVLDELHKFFEEPSNIINILSGFQRKNANRQAQVDEERASLSAQLATVRRKITNTADAISEKSKSPALLKKLAALEEEESALLSRIAQLNAQSTAPIQVPTEAQARPILLKIQSDLRAKDPAHVRQTLLGLISEVSFDRIDKQLIGRIVYFHTPTAKKKT